MKYLVTKLSLMNLWSIFAMEYYRWKMGSRSRQKIQKIEEEFVNCAWHFKKLDHYDRKRQGRNIEGNRETDNEKKMPRNRVISRKRYKVDIEIFVYLLLHF